MRRWRISIGVAVGLALALALVARGAQADIRRDADALATVWERGGATVDRRAPLFLEAGQARRLRLGQRLVPGTCVSLVAVAARPLRLILDAVHDSAPRGVVAASEAGVLVAEDCGGGTLAGDGLLRVEGGRGAVELMLVRHEGPVTPVSTILPERAVGAVAPREGDAGSLALAPAVERLTRARRAAVIDGAELVLPVAVQADDRGQQAVVLNLRQGCHRLVVVADSTPGEPVDVDAEAVVAGTETLLRRDRSHAPDARLDFCLGAVQRVELRVAGAAPQGGVTILDALWTLPAGLPTDFGDVATAGLAWALHRRHAPRLDAPPIAEVVGVPGATVLSAELEPDACYVAAVALIRGSALVGRLTVTTGATMRHDDAAEEPHSAAVSFCADGARRASLQIDLRAEGGLWLLALWRLGDTP